MNADLRISFAVGLLISAIGMKLLSIRALPSFHERKELLKFAASPLFSISTWIKSRRASPQDLKPLILNALGHLVLLILSYIIFWRLANLFRSGTFAVSYMAIFPVLLLGETFGPMLQMMYYPLGRIIPSHHRFPLASRSVADFWSRWNTWLNDWFREVLFRPLRRTPVLASFLVFIFSGAWHEAVLNFPAKYFYGVNFLGSMLLYFFIQWVGVIAERRFLKTKGTMAKRAYAWLIVVGPCPLILNEPTLRIISLWPFS